MSNLIDNSIKYSKGQPKIVIQTFNSGQNIIITISDNGIGIEKEYQKKVFEKFFRVPTGNVHDVKGFRLGLAYIKRSLNYTMVQSYCRVNRAEEQRLP
ncbi:MAG: ATP-binding protein [Bacteroidetes bacterium]|nr:ATP-binding protein [Bacteroidota bacterium]